MEDEKAAVQEEVWTSSAQGGALPRTVREILMNIRFGVRNNPRLGPVSAKELLILAHDQRRDALGLAARTLSDLPESMVDERAMVIRNAQGKLMLEKKQASPEKGEHMWYSAQRLGCPALRETHSAQGALRPEERMLLGYANYVDHLLAIVLTEAYERGIFRMMVT
jgi:hypothetical protein